VYAIIGCGKCGSSLLGALLATQTRELRNLYFPVAVGSTVDDLRRSGTSPGIWLGVTPEGELMYGREKGFGETIKGGIGKDFAKGYDFFQKARDNLEDGFDEVLPGYSEGKINLVILFFSVGGGTGGGSASVLAQLFKDNGMRVIGVGVLPAESEDPRMAWNAYCCLRESLDKFDGLLLADNNMIDRSPGLDSFYKSFNAYITGCVSDLIFSSIEAGPGINHGVMSSSDYQDIFTSLTIGDVVGIGALGRVTISMGYFRSISNLEPVEWVERARNHLTLEVPDGFDKIKKLHCIATMHSSFAKKQNFPSTELRDVLRSITPLGAITGLNVTKKRMLRLTLILMYNPGDVLSLRRLKEKAEKYKKLEDEEKGLWKSLFEER